MIFGTPGQTARMTDIKIEHAGVRLQRTDSYKYLGVKLDTKLSFSEHVFYVKGKTYSKIKLLGRLSYILDTDTLFLLCKSLVLPIFDYADIIYHNLNQV